MKGFINVFKVFLIFLASRGFLVFPSVIKSENQENPFQKWWMEILFYSVSNYPFVFKGLMRFLKED